MAPADESQPSPSTLDALIRLAKKISLLTGLVTGLGLVALYFFGIAIFASYSSASRWSSSCWWRRCGNA